MEFIAVIFLFAMLVESLTEYVFGGISKLAPYLKYIALLVGVAVSVLYKIDVLFALFGLQSIPVVGWIISGLIIGRGSNYVNDFISLARPK